MSITPEQAAAKAQEWHGEAGGALLPQLTANELAGIVNEALMVHTKRLLTALDGMDLGCTEPGFNGFENGYGDSSAGDELEAARQELVALVGHVPAVEEVTQD